MLYSFAVIERRLKEYLRAKLVECGWRDDMKNFCKGCSTFGSYDAQYLDTLTIIVTKQSPITYTSLVVELRPNAWDLVVAALVIVRVAQDIVMIARWNKTRIEKH